MIRAWQRALRLLNMTPEAERVEDVWDMAVFGYTGHISFAPVLQEPLREAMKIWVYDDLPRRRNKNAVQHARTIIAAVGMLSESLRLQREDGGAEPAAWGRGDIVAFTPTTGATSWPPGTTPTTPAPAPDASAARPSASTARHSRATPRL
ncbi:hypothetical protein ACIGZI_33475 [Streptomyces griseus]|uniref:hypothetical protein n=1 Tax=Streptomyces griseus TaxID=1911 RepID=UPI0037D6A2F5